MYLHDTRSSWSKKLDYDLSDRYGLQLGVVVCLAVPIVAVKSTVPAAVVQDRFLSKALSIMRLPQKQSYG